MDISDEMQSGPKRSPLDTAFQQIVESVPVPVAVTTPTGEVESLNRLTLEYFGKSFEELKAWQASDVVHEHDLEQTIAAQLKAHSEGLAYNVESRHRRADGNYRWFNVRGFPLRDDRGNILRWFHLLIDIDDQKRAQESLRLAERERTSMINTLPTPAWSALPDGACDFINHRWLEYTGLSVEDAMGSGWSAAVHPDDVGPLMEHRRTCYGTGTPMDFEARLRRFDGEYRWFLLRANPLSNELGEIIKWFGTAVDIDDRKRAEEIVNASKRDLDQIINAIPALAWSTDREGSADFFNQHYLDYTGMTSEEAKGWGWTKCVYPDDVKVLAATWQDILASEEPGDAEARLRRFDGEYRWFLFRAHPLRDDTGKIVKWFGTNTDIHDRKLGEILVRESEQRFRAIFDEAGTGIALLDLSFGEPIQNNRALQRMLDCTEEELGLFATYDQLTAESDREADARSFTQLCEGRVDSLRLEKHFILKNGRSVWANAVFTLLRGPAGEPRHVIVIHEDVTEEKLALQELQAKQDLLDLAQKAARAMAFDWYIQEKVNTWTPQQESLYGLEPGTFDGTFESWKRLIYPQDWPIVVDTLKRAQESGEISIEFRVVWPDGTTHWLSANGQMFFDEDGKPFRMVGFTADVTARKLVEEELRRSEALLAQAQHVSSTGGFFWRPATGEIIWSEEVYRIFEVESSLVVTPELILTRLHPGDHGAFDELLALRAAEGGDFVFEHRLLLPDGRVKYLHTVAHETREENGQLLYVAAVQDVTDRHRSEEELARARSELARASRVASLGALAASIAHEVNQPLSGIVTNASTCLRMLAADPPNLDGARKTVERTIRDGHRASDVIRHLRSLFTNREVAMKPLDLNKTVQEVVALSRMELQRGKVVVKYELAEPLSMVNGDRVQLQQVILNFLLNAADAMSGVEDRERQMILRTEGEDDGSVRLTVQDAGTGLSGSDLNRLFEPFYTTKKDGMGIGLSVSRTIIETHNGRLWASANNGPGASFSFSIPSVVGAAAAPDAMPLNFTKPIQRTRKGKL